MAFEFTVFDIIPASPREVYDAWLSSEGHKKITGGESAQISAAEGVRFKVWSGFILGRNLKLEPGRRIVQSWRTTKFRMGDEDSKIEVLLEAVPGGTKLTLHHSNVPESHTNYRDGGWRNHYFEPMKRYFKRMREDSLRPDLPESTI